MLLNPLPILALAVFGLAGCSTVPTEWAAGSESVARVRFPQNGEWLELAESRFQGEWELIPFGGEGDVQWREDGWILNRGEPLTGVRCMLPLPVMNYEIELEAARLQGGDFFCGLTVPVGDSHCSLIIGGWGGGVVGISSLDGHDASENETTRLLRFESGRWYHIRLRVTVGKIEAWLDDEQIVNVSIQNRHVALRPGMIGLSRPLGICSWETRAGVRNVRLRTIATAGL